MRLFKLFTLFLQFALSVTPAAAKPHCAVYSAEVANPHGRPTENQAKNGSQNCGLDDCGSQISARSEALVVANEAAHSWANKHINLPMRYWELTPDTIRESGAQDFFFGWLEEYKNGKIKTECDNTRHTAIQCFAAMWWGDFDYTCSIDQIERCSVPTANSISHWIEKTQEWTPSKVADTARKVYLIYKHFQISISDLKSDWVSYL